MPSNIRVYELARELGLTNKETLDLCVALGIGVKSHSSSVVEAQADRVRRKAEREGLVRDEQPEEPEAPAKKAAAKKAPAKKAAAKSAPEEPTTETVAEPTEVAPAPAPVAEPEIDHAPPTPTPAPATPKRVISSSGDRKSTRLNSSH